MLKAKRKYLLWHIIGSMIFLALPIVLSPHPPEATNFITSRPTIRDFIANGLMLIFFYVNYYSFIPKLYFQKKYVVYGSCITLIFLAICILPSLLAGHVPWQPDPSMPGVGFPTGDGGAIPPKPENSTFIQEIKHHIYLFAAVVLFSILLRVRDRLAKTESARHQAELDSLKAQINPHFLFNTLNNIYAMAIRDKSHTTATSIIKLSGLMRYVITDTGRKFVSLEKEIDYINDYIELQKIRLDKRVKLFYDVTGYVEDQQIAPLTLIPFIENAFKHGVNPDENSSIKISIEIEEAYLELKVENKKVKVQLDSHEKSGKGIENTKSRLQLLYPSRHLLTLSEDDETFRVQLIIHFT